MWKFESPFINKLHTKLLSDESLTSKAYLNGVAAALDYFARLIVGFLLVPLLLGHLGDYLYGVWQILGKFIGYISAASGRPTQALKWTIARQQSSIDYDEKRRNVGSAQIVWAIFLPILSFFGGLLAWFAPNLLRSPDHLSTTIRLTASILVANLIFTNLADIPQSVLRGENLGYKRMGASTLFVLLGGVLTGVALYFKTGLIGIASATLGTTVLTGIFFLQVVRLYVPWFGFLFPSIDKIKTFISLSGWFLAWQFLHRLMISVDVVILGFLDSVENVTVYSVTKYVPEIVINVVAVVVGGVLPGLGGVIGLHDHKRAASIRSWIMSITWLVATIGGSTILLLGPSFTALWTGNDYYAGSIPAFLIMISVVQFVFIRNDANIIDLTLNLRAKVALGTISIMIAVIASLFFMGVKQLGITGLCVSMIIGRLILSIYYPVIVGHYLGYTFRGQITKIFRPCLITISFFLLSVGMSKLFLFYDWLSMFTMTLVALILFSFLSISLGFSTQQRSVLFRQLQKFKL